MILEYIYIYMMKSLHLVNDDRCYYASSIIKIDRVIREQKRILFVHLSLFLILTLEIVICVNDLQCEMKDIKRK